MEQPLILNAGNVEEYFDKTTLLVMPEGTGVLGVEEITKNTFVNWVFAMHLRMADGQEETVYVRQSRDHVKEYKDLPRDPKRVETEARALEFINTVAPGSVPGVISLDKTNNVLVLSDIRQAGHLLADEFAAGRVHEEIGTQFGRTIGHIQKASFGFSFGEILGDKSIQESEDENAYLGSRAQAPMRLFPEQTRLLLEESSNIQRCFVVGDLSPKNVFVDGADARFLDLERTSTGDPAYDPAYIITHFLIDVDSTLHPRSLAFVKNFMDSYTETVSRALSREEVAKLQNRITRFVGFSILHRTQGSHFVSYSGEDKDVWQEKAGTLISDVSSVSVVDAIAKILDLDR
jgi:5-methylthioribose kinase